MEPPRTFTRRQVALGTAGLAATLAVAPKLVRVPPHVAAQAEGDLYYTTSSVRLRSGPGLGYAVLRVLPTGTVIYLLEWAGSADGYTWAKVLLYSETDGYLATEFATPGAIASTFPNGSIVHVDTGSGGAANLRSGPSLSSPIILRVPNGTTGMVYGSETRADGYTWIQVTMGSTHGWMATSVLAAGAGTSTPSSGGTFPIGSTVHVETYSGGSANLRSGPGLSNPVVKVVPTGTTSVVLSGETASDGYQWIKVTMGGVTGYMATSVLAAGSGSTTPPPPPSGGFAVGDWVTVSATTVNFRSQPSISATVVMVLSRGRHLVVTGGPVSANGYVWYQAQTTQATGSVTGWVIGSALIPQHPETPGESLRWDVGSVAYVNTDRLNLRAEPALSATIVAVLPRDTALTITGSPVGADGYSWYPGTTAAGKSGWAAGQLMR